MQTHMMWRHHKKYEAGLLFLYTFVLVVGAIAYFFLNQRVALLLGAARYGDFCVAFNLLILFGVVSILGFDYLISIEFPIMIKSGMTKGVKLIMGLLHIVLPIIIALMAIGACLIILFFLGQYFQTLNMLLNLIHPFMYFIWAVPIFGLYRYFLSITRVLGFYTLSLALDSVIFPIVVFLIFLVVAQHDLGENDFTTIRILFAPVIASVILLAVFLTGVVFYLRKRHLALRNIYIHSDLEDKSLVQVSIKFLLSIFILNNIGSLVLVVLELVGRDEKSVGFFAACFQCLSVTVFSVLASLGFVLAPKFSRLLHGGNRAKTQRFLTAAHLALIVFAVVVCGVVYTEAPWLLAGFGADFSDPAPVTMLRLSILLILPTIIVYYTNNMIAARVENATLAFRIAVIYCILVVLVAIPLSYYFEGTGAVIAVFGTNILYYVLYTVLLYKKERLRPI